MSACAPLAQVVQGRPMREADLDAVHQVERQAYSHPWTRGNLADSLRDGHWTDLHLDARGGVCAYSVAMAGVDEVHLLNLTVAPAWQGRGLARELLARLYRRTADAGLPAVLLEVRPSNVPARRLYAREGFVEIGLRRGYYPADGGAREDALVLRLELARLVPLAVEGARRHALD